MPDSIRAYPRKVLYVEDDVGLARVIQKQLGRLGYDGSIALDGAIGA